MSSQPLPADTPGPELPRSVRLAGDLAGLDQFLEDAAIGFHWDLLDRLEDGVYLLDPQRRIVYWSDGAERVTGYSASEVLGRGCADNLLCHVDTGGNCLCQRGCPVTAVLHGRGPQGADVFLKHRNGHRVPVHVYAAPIRQSSGEVIGAFETFSDATARSVDLERIRQLEAAAYLDPLTGVPNRRFLEAALDGRFAEMRHHGLQFGFVLVDIDHFKHVNDIHGHAMGDRVLQMVAKTLSNACRARDVVVRWGGEEFAVLGGTATAQGTAQLGERLRAMVAASSLKTRSGLLRATVSVGATLARAGDSPADLFARADGLLYQSKSSGRDRVSFST